MLRPLIGITAYDYVKPNGLKYDVCYEKNATAIEAAGGVPVLIPSNLSIESLRVIYERLDAILLPGGGDMNPEAYKTTAEDDIPLYDVSDNRDALEISLAQWAVEDDVPVFGICRGIQVMNVALGGSLVQDINKHIKTDLRHMITSLKEESRDKILHDVSIEAGTRLSSILGEKEIPVNSLHHQALGEVAPGATITALSPDGIIEGIELADKHFVMAVQWHPEDLVENDERMKNLFTSFVQAARERLGKKMQSG